MASMTGFEGDLYGLKRNASHENYSRRRRTFRSGYIFSLSRVAFNPTCFVLKFLKWTKPTNINFVLAFELDASRYRANVFQQHLADGPEVFEYLTLDVFRRWSILGLNFRKVDWELLILNDSVDYLANAFCVDRLNASISFLYTISPTHLNPLRFVDFFLDKWSVNNILHTSINILCCRMTTKRIKLHCINTICFKYRL